MPHSSRQEFQKMYICYQHLCLNKNKFTCPYKLIILFITSPWRKDKLPPPLSINHFNKLDSRILCHNALWILCHNPLWRGLNFFQSASNQATHFEKKMHTDLWRILLRTRKFDWNKIFFLNFWKKITLTPFEKGNWLCGNKNYSKE